MILFSNPFRGQDDLFILSRLPHHESSMINILSVKTMRDKIVLTTRFAASILKH
jgi:hypothetical protein